MSRPAPARRVRLLVPAGLLAGALVQANAFWPGVMIWDAIRQYRQALAGHYDDWHPPAMNWLWRQLLAVAPGPAPMFVLQLLLYWSGFALICDRAARDGRPRLAVAIGLCALLPAPFLLMGSVVKDSLMAATLLLATGLIARRPLGERLSGGIALALLLAAATLRFNAVPACLPLALVALPQAWRAGRGRFALATVALALPLVLALPLANRALDAAKSGVEQSLIIYDLGGITHFSGVSVFPDVGVADPARVAGDCYSPVEWDRYAWWGEEPCAIGFANVGPALARGGVSPWMLWASAVAHHPLAYAEHRLDHYNAELRFWLAADAVRDIPVASDPNPWGFVVPPGPLYRLVTEAGEAAIHSPLGWPACWPALGLGLLPLLRTRPQPIVLALLASALLYELSYLPLGVASELRYRFWPMSAIAIAAATLLTERAIAPRWRIAAVLPAAAVALLCLVARMTA